MTGKSLIQVDDPVGRAGAAARASSRASPSTSTRASASARSGWRTGSAGSSRGRRCGSSSPASSASRPATSTFAIGPHGKPELPGSALRFNLSHSGDRALIALASGVEVGVDVERTARRSRAVERTLTAGERAAMRGADRHVELLQIWCRKEALAKALGGGLGWAPEDFDTSRPDGHVIEDLDLGDGYVGAVAVAAERFALERRGMVSVTSRETTIAM